MEPTTTRDRTTIKDWLITLAALTLIAFGSAAIAAIPHLGLALIVAGTAASPMIVATVLLARRTR